MPGIDNLDGLRAHIRSLSEDALRRYDSYAVSPAYYNTPF
jgi:hypothetical protein